MNVGALCRGWLRLAIFACGLLVGIQVPSYTDQYQKRVDAHLLEVSRNISGFQATAKELFDGDMQALIAYYENSNDRVFQGDADSIRNIVERYDTLLAEQQAISAHWLKASLHMLLTANPELRAEAIEQYSYTVPLDIYALEWGFSMAILVTLLIEALIGICARCLPGSRKRRMQHSLR